MNNFLLTCSNLHNQKTSQEYFHLLDLLEEIKSLKSKGLRKFQKELKEIFQRLFSYSVNYFKTTNEKLRNVCCEQYNEHKKILDDLKKDILKLNGFNIKELYKKFSSFMENFYIQNVLNFK